MAAKFNKDFNPAATTISAEDISEFEDHYLKNREIWDKAFSWLKNTDLQHITSGKYPLDNENLFAIVSEYPTKPTDEIMFEAHRKYIDIQYVVKGKELIGVASLSNAKEKIPFDAEKDIAFYEIRESDSKFYEAGPDKFFIFFPADAHKPGIKVGEGEKVRKVVVKLLV